MQTEVFIGMNIPP